MPKHLYNDNRYHHEIDSLDKYPMKTGDFNINCLACRFMLVLHKWSDKIFVCPSCLRKGKLFNEKIWIVWYCG